MYADDHDGRYPMACNVALWGIGDEDGYRGWMEQVFAYVKSKEIYRCPSNADYPQYSYFLGTRAAYIAANYNRAPVNRARIEYPSAFVLGGDTALGGESEFLPENCDKDDYTPNCVGGPTNGRPWVEWRVHNEGQNILFADGHVKWFKGYDPGQITFRYNEMHRWQ